MSSFHGPNAICCERTYSVRWRLMGVTTTLFITTIIIILSPVIRTVIIESTMPSYFRHNNTSIDQMLSFIISRQHDHQDEYNNSDTNGTSNTPLQVMKPVLTSITVSLSSRNSSIAKKRKGEIESTIKMNVRVSNQRRRKASDAISMTSGQSSNIHNDMELIRHDMAQKSSSLTAIVHLGPQKTGSSSLQAFLQKYLVDDLIHDNYRLVPDVNYPKIGAAKSFTSCFTGQKLGIKPHTDGIDYMCHDTTLSDTVEVATQYHSNLLYTSETIADTAFDENALYDFLIPYWKEIHVVGYYRRFYSWLTSLHNEQNKHKNIPSRTPLSDFIEKSQRLDYIYNGYYIIGTIHRFQHHPYNRNNQNANIHVYNLHNLLESNYNEGEIETIDILEHFYCIAIPYAKQTCEKTKEILSMGKVLKTNEQHELVYIELVYYARELGYIKTETSNTNGHRLDDNVEDFQLIKSIATEAQYFHRQVLKHNKYQFSPILHDALICPTDEAHEYLLQLSIQAEKELFPTTYDESVIREDFLSYRNSYKFCHIDAKKVLQENYYGWRDYFLKLEI